MEIKYFFDTYALVELIKGNLNYTKYSDTLVTLTIFNLVELYWAILRDFGEQKAKEIYKKFKECVVEVDDDTIFDAMMFKKNYKKSDFSYTDVIGYFFAKRNNFIFLTGDKEFKSLENVEFVK